MFTTISEIQAAKTSELIAFYNSRSGKPPIRKFSTRAAAEKQATSVLNGADTGALASNPKVEAKRAKVAKAKTVDERAAAISASWSDPAIRKARTQRNEVRVAGVVYPSVPMAFRALKLPMSRMAKFRKALKAAGRDKFEGHNFILIAEAAAE